MNISISPLLTMGLCLMFPTAGQGASITINDMEKLEPNIQVVVSDFEGGFSVNGTLLETGYTTGSIVVNETPGQLTFHGSWEDLGASGSGT